MGRKRVFPGRALRYDIMKIIHASNCVHICYEFTTQSSPGLSDCPLLQAGICTIPGEDSMSDRFAILR